MNNLTFKDLTLEWLSLKKLYIKHSSFVKYETMIYRHIFPFFSTYNLEDINTQCMISFFEMKKNAKVSTSVLSTLKSILSSIMSYASENYHFKSINFKQIKIPTIPKTRNVLSYEEREKILLYAKHNINPLSISLLLALYGGLRLGEICALKWENIDFDNQIIFICKTATRLKCKESKDKKTEVILQTPKSLSSYREVPIPTFVFEYIKLYKHFSKEHFYLLSNSNKIYEPRRLEKNFSKFCHENQIHSTFHNLRHSYATECVRVNMEIKTLSEILGHSNVSTTLNLYVHTSLEHKKKEIKKIQIPHTFVD